MEQETVQYPHSFNIKYKIISIDENEHSMIVRYWSDFLSEEEIAIDDTRHENGTPIRCRTDCNMNIWDNLKTEKDIHNYIISNAPISWFKLQYKSKYPEKFNNEGIISAKNLLNKSYEKDIELKSNIDGEPKEKELTEEEIENLLEDLLNN